MLPCADLKAEQEEQITDRQTDGQMDRQVGQRLPHLFQLSSKTYEEIQPDFHFLEEYTPDPITQVITLTFAPTENKISYNTED